MIIYYVFVYKIYFYESLKNLEKCFFEKYYYYYYKQGSFFLIYFLSYNGVNFCYKYS